MSKVFREAANEITGFASSFFHDPGEQRSCCRFTMRPGNNQRTFAADEKLLEQFRQRTVAKFFFQNRFGFRVAARDGVADDDQVRSVREVLFGVPGHHLDFSLRQKGGHGRIDILVGAGDADRARDVAGAVARAALAVDVGARRDARAVARGAAAARGAAGPAVVT